MVLLTSLNPAIDAVLRLGPSRERTANGRRSTPGSQGHIAAIDERPGGATSAAARASRVPKA